MAAGVRGIVAAVGGVMVVMMVMAMVVTEAKVAPPSGLSADLKNWLRTRTMKTTKKGLLPIWLDRPKDDNDGDSDSDPSSDVTSDEEGDDEEEEEKAAGGGPLSPPPSRKRRSLYIDFDRDLDDYMGPGGYNIGFRRRYGGYGSYYRVDRYGRVRYGRYGQRP